MATYEQATDVDVTADVLFDYLSEISNLPKYFPQMTSVKKLDGDKIHTTAEIDPDQDGKTQTVEGEAWFRVNDAEQKIEWGSPGPNDYHGELEVSKNGQNSTVSVLIHTTHVDGPPIDDGIRETLAHIKRLVEAG